MIAWLALILWPIISMIFYNRMTLPGALCATIIGGYLLLPTATSLDLPLLPALDKTSIPSLIALVMTAVAIRSNPQGVLVLSGWIPRSTVVRALLGLLLVGAFGSVLTNLDAQIFGERYLRGHSLYDAFSSLLGLMMMLIPLFLARRVLSSREGQRTLLLILVLSVFAYSFLAAYEIRMSPQLNIMVYGFFPHEFAQQMRGGGFRPVVFVGHGLEVSLLFVFALIGCASLLRSTTDQSRLQWLFLLAWLAVILVLSKSLGALIIALLLVPAVLFLSQRLQMALAISIACIVLAYPALRAADAIPVDRVMAFAEDINPERARSFKIRTDNETMLLARAQERPVFGWGGWGRQRVFDEDGRNISITDGSWVIEIGAGGWVRYIGIFGLLCWPVIGLFFAKRDKLDPICVALVLILSAKLVDLIPNSGMPPTIWLIVGSLIGRLEMAREAKAGQEAVKVPNSKPSYSRRTDLPEVKKQPPEPRYARKFPSKGGSTAGSEDGAPQKLSYKRPKPAGAYRK